MNGKHADCRMMPRRDVPAAHRPFPDKETVAESFSNSLLFDTARGIYDRLFMTGKILTIDTICGILPNGQVYSSGLSRLRNRCPEKRLSAMFENLAGADELRVLRRENTKNREVKCGSAVFGNGHFSVIAGPCSVEDEDEIMTVAACVKRAGARMLRGGAFKPRTSPYAFQGLEKEGIDLLVRAGKQNGLSVVTEITDIRNLDMYRDVDMLQVGARSMSNFALLKELSRCKKPVLLKRGMSATVEEWLLSAEYLLSGGNEDVVLCERGIRTFEPATRNTLDLSAIPLVKELSFLPVIADPSHATGRYELVRPMSLAAVAAGADGLMIEVHDHPGRAKSDGGQSLKTDVFEAAMKQITALSELMNGNEFEKCVRPFFKQPTVTLPEGGL